MDPLAMRWHGRFGPRQKEKIEAFGELMTDYPHLAPRFNAHDRSLLLAFLRRRDIVAPNCAILLASRMVSGIPNDVPAGQKPGFSRAAWFMPSQPFFMVP